MLVKAVRGTAAVCLFLPFVGVAEGQSAPSPAESAIDLIRTLEQIGESDQARIADWVREEVDRLGQAPETERLEAAKKFREKFKKQFEDSRNTQAFKAQLPAQTARVAEQYLLEPKTDRVVAYAVVRVLVDMNRPEGLSGFLAGLKSSAPAARYLSSRGIYELHQAVAGDKDSVDRAIGALREAATAETSPVALSQMLRALGFPTQPAAVFDAYLGVLDKRLPELAKGTGSVTPEIEAFHYFRNPSVLSALNQAQKSQLAARLASLLRIYAGRYDVANLKFDETDRLERALWSVEDILEALAGAGGGAVRKVLEEGGYQRRGDVGAEVIQWIGDPRTNTAGSLNAAPWNVPIGGLVGGDASAKDTGSTD